MQRKSFALLARAFFVARIQFTKRKGLFSEPKVFPLILDDIGFFDTKLQILESNWSKWNN